MYLWEKKCGCKSHDNTYNGPDSVMKAVAVVAVLALLGLWAAVIRRR
jgi:hypothetical protein